MEERNLTDADIEALSDALEKKLLGRFYLNLGKGIFSMVWKGVIVTLLAIAAYGQFKGLK